MDRIQPNHFLKFLGPYQKKKFSLPIKSSPFILEVVEQVFYSSNRVFNVLYNPINDILLRVQDL